MINALRYEPRGQRQQFEPRNWQRDETRYKHIHLNLHLHPGMRIRRFSQPTIASITTIFAAFIGALSMALSFFPSVFPHLLSLFALPYSSWLLQLIGMLVALAVAVYALFSPSRSREQAQARPKDASPHEFDWSEERQGYRR